MASVKMAVLLLVVFYVSLQKAEDLSVGTHIYGQLAHSERVKLSGHPLRTKTGNVYYSGHRTRIIKAIWAIDLDRSKAKVTITEGGLGHSFVKLRLRSARGEGLNYQIQIYV